MLSDVTDGEELAYSAVVIASAAAGEHTNVATITDGPCVEDGCTDDETVVVRIPALVIDKAADAEQIVISGPNDALVATPSVVTWTLTYTLTDGPVTNAVITDEIPAGFVFLDAADGGHSRTARSRGPSRPCRRAEASRSGRRSTRRRSPGPPRP